MKRVYSDLKRYNANSDDRYMGDCVKRAISLAFGLDYQQAGSELTKLAKNFGTSYNSDRNIDRYLASKGIKPGSYSEAGITVDEFSKKHPSGTYLILTYNKADGAIKGISNHLLTVIDGDVYDSWDSLGQYVSEWWKVTDEKTTFNELTYDDILDDIVSFMRQYAEQLDKKFKYGSVTVGDHSFDVSQHSGKKYGHVDKTTFEVMIGIKFDANTIPRHSSWSYNGAAHKTIAIKINPRLSLEENLSNNMKRIKQRMYDFVYNIAKEISDTEKADQLTSNPNYRGYVRDLMKVPEWARPYVTYIDERSDYEVHTYDYDKYYVVMEALPDDPRASESEEVIFRADSLRELKRDMESYRKDYARFGYDY